MTASSSPGDDAVWTCEEVLLRIYEFIDGELAAADDEAVRDHLNACAVCRPSYSSERAFLRFLSGRARIEQCPEELRQRLLAALRAGQAIDGRIERDEV